MVSGNFLKNRRNSFFSLWGLILGSAFLFLASYFLNAPVARKRSQYLTPPPVIANLSFGYKIQTADAFWLRAIQDFDYCDQPLNEKECRGESWLFHLIDLTTNLDSKFRDAYYYGAMALTILVSDYRGASEIFDKGVQVFPEDWRLNYLAGYHALFEEKNKLKASKLYYAAAAHGAPAWVNVLAGRLAYDSGENEFAAKILEEMIKNNQEPSLTKRLKKKLERIQQ